MCVLHSGRRQKARAVCRRRTTTGIRGCNPAWPRRTPWRCCRPPGCCRLRPRTAGNEVSKDIFSAVSAASSLVKPYQWKVLGGISAEREGDIGVAFAKGIGVFDGSDRAAYATIHASFGEALVGTERLKFGPPYPPMKKRTLYRLPGVRPVSVKVGSVSPYQNLAIRPSS